MSSGAAPTLETARLRLRAQRPTDLAAICAMASDPAVTRHISGPQPREETWRRVLSGAGLWSLLGYGYWVVERRADGAVIGQAGLADFKRDMEPGIENLPELGFMFASHAHGQGFATEAVGAILAWADATLSADQIVAIVNEDNDSSIRILQRAGFASRELAQYKCDPVLLFRRFAV